MIVLSGADIVLPDRILSPGTLAIDDGRICDVRVGGTAALHGHYIVPGLIDVHVHGVGGVDTLDGAGVVEAIARALPRYGVTGFCPTTVACSPADLRQVVDQVRQARQARQPNAARVLPAHLESNFISPEYCGAQPQTCLRIPAAGADVPAKDPNRPAGSETSRFTSAEILAEIERGGPDVGIVTLAPELAGAIDLTKSLVARGHTVSLGHSAATYEQALEAIAAGARQATHLFNRMPPLLHRAPGLAGAVLQTDEVAAELVCDGFHVHAALVRASIAAKRPGRVMAITDGTAVSGLAVGTQARLGGQTISAGPRAAFLADGTLAGSVMTMDRVLKTLVTEMDVSLTDAVTMCATTPARELGLVGYGLVAVDAPADLVVLDAQFRVVQTYIGGHLVYNGA